MAGDAHHNEDVSLQITYKREYKEDVQNPGTELSYPAQSPEEFIKVAQWKINRIFYFLIFTSIGCMSAVVLAPGHIVAMTAGVIWINSVGLARFLLSGAYRWRGNRHT